LFIWAVFLNQKKLTEPIGKGCIQALWIEVSLYLKCMFFHIHRKEEEELHSDYFNLHFLCCKQLIPFQPSHYTNVTFNRWLGEMFLLKIIQMNTQITFNITIVTAVKHNNPLLHLSIMPHDSVLLWTIIRQRIHI
jgi:hypothetical protein